MQPVQRHFLFANIVISVVRIDCYHLRILIEDQLQVYIQKEKSCIFRDIYLCTKCQAIYES